MYEQFSNACTSQIDIILYQFLNDLCRPSWNFTWEKKIFEANRAFLK